MPARVGEWLGDVACRIEPVLLDDLQFPGDSAELELADVHRIGLSLVRESPEPGRQPRTVDLGVSHAAACFFKCPRLW